MSGGIRQRYVLRLHLELRACLEEEATRQGVRTATLVTRLLEQEAAKAGGVGYRLHPLLTAYAPSRNSKALSAGQQMSIFLTPECRAVVEEICERTGYKVKFVVPGMLLNTPVCAPLTAAQRPPES